ncbi:ThiF family adenylyltransferase [Bacteroides fragilis]
MFGRGAFCETFTKKKILVIGVGAIGSMFAKTLVKCGCTNISLLDYDLKKPENICRSEYTFLTGVTDKVTELSAELSAISPYVEIKCLPNQYDLL